MRPPLKGIGTKPGVYKTQGFGERPEFYKPSKGHPGVDYGAPKRTPIIAVKAARLEYGVDPKGYGNFARLYTDEYEIIYGHMDGFEGENRTVKEGEIIGYVGTTGNSSGYHLHFGIRKIINGQVQDYQNGYFGYFDPEPFIKMSQTKVVKSKSSQTVYLCYPVPSETHLQERADLEGFDIPEKIPDTDSLK
jgi:murein DD-endopeptidase MepM/ murein hydrolase activator NlpD